MTTSTSQFTAGGLSSGIPFIFPIEFGGGKDGALTAINQADIGQANFGVKQYTSLIIPAGVTWTVGQGLSGGAALIAVSGTLTLAGSIVADGAAGGAGTIAQGGAGGATAGGAAGATAQSSNGAGNNGSVLAATLFGHGLLGSVGTSANNQAAIGAGAGSGAFESNNATSVAGGVTGASITPNVYTASSTAVTEGDLLYNWAIQANNLVRFNPKIWIPATGGTASSGGTTPATQNTPTFQAGASPLGNVLSFLHLVAGNPGTGGGVTGVAAQQAGGGGGGGAGGIVYIECQTLNLVSGFSLSAKGGNGGNGFSSNGTTAVAAGGTGGDGGQIIIIARNVVGTGSFSANVNGGSAGSGAGTSAANGLAGRAGLALLLRA